MSKLKAVRPKAPRPNRKMPFPAPVKVAGEVNPNLGIVSQQLERFERVLDRLAALKPDGDGPAPSRNDPGSGFVSVVPPTESLRSLGVGPAIDRDPPIAFEQMAYMVDDARREAEAVYAVAVSLRAVVFGSESVTPPTGNLAANGLFAKPWKDAHDARERSVDARVLLNEVLSVLVVNGPTAVAPLAKGGR